MEKEIQIVRENIRKACERSGRKPEEVLLIGVSKTKPYAAVQEAYSYGIRDFGENKVQEIRDKFALLQEDALLQKEAPSFHMIGSLQKNKVKYLPGKVKMIHSIDSLPLALEVEKEYAKKEEIASVLLEVNVAKEESKSGFFLEDVEQALEECKSLPHVKLCGLMTVAPFTENPEENRVHFRALKSLLTELQKKYPALPLKELSMGMSGDYEVAIEEGATMVRIGSFIFGARDYGNAHKS